MIRLRPRLSHLAFMVAVISLSACVTVSPPRFLQFPADRAWAPTLDSARKLADAGRGTQADSLLAEYAAAFPTTPQAVEANYWRALLNLRSSSATPGISAAIPLLQTYLAAGPTTEHATEAVALLRVASRVDTLSRIAATYVSRGEVMNDAAAAAATKSADTRTAEVKASTADSKAQDEEIKRLKDELAKTKDELDRIKKRLAEPPKKPPTSLSP